MKDDSRKRISDFSDEKYIVATEYAKGRLPSLNFHLGALKSNYNSTGVTDLDSQAREDAGCEFWLTAKRRARALRLLARTPAKARIDKRCN